MGRRIKNAFRGYQNYVQVTYKKYACGTPEHPWLPRNLV
jgi:hypothetical protein